METREKMEVRNRQTLAVLLKSGHKVELIPSDNKNVAAFLSIDEQTSGYVSPKAWEFYKGIKAKLAKIAEDFLDEAEQALQRRAVLTEYVKGLQYAECRKPGQENWVPCLMIVGKRKPALLTLTADDVDI